MADRSVPCVVTNAELASMLDAASAVGWMRDGTRTLGLIGSGTQAWMQLCAPATSCA